MPDFQNGGAAPDDTLEPLHDGYILQDGMILAADLPHLESLNKFAYDVIKTQVRDHFEGLQEGQEPDWFTLRNDLFDMLKSHTKAKASVTIEGFKRQSTLVGKAASVVSPAAPPLVSSTLKRGLTFAMGRPMARIGASG